MKAKTLLRLFKAMFFIVGLIGYGMLVKTSNNWWATSVFAVVLAMYIIELYGREK